MQILADVLDRPINVPASDQAVALGAAVFAATVAGLYPGIEAAQKALCSPIDRTYHPNPERVKVYDGIYRKYKALGAFMEQA
jgi:L-ribulokinase